MTNMYADAKTWSPFVGCEFDCVYCRPSFQAQAKRQRKNCERCYDYTPHYHPERLSRIPSAEIVFCCASGDISFCDGRALADILVAVTQHAARRAAQMKPPVTYYWQSKDPQVLSRIAPHVPQSSTLVTTLETNRNEGYDDISKAPPPTERWDSFCRIDYPRKVLTLEPLLAFDAEDLAAMVVAARPEYVWIGLNSKPKQVQLPEPSPDDIRELLRLFGKSGIEVRRKDLRGLK